MMFTIAKRNIKIFFRDKTSVFFSLLSVFIIIGLYVLFLGDTIVSSLPDIEGARFLMDSWMSAGLVAVTSITTTMGAFGIMVDDKTKKVLKDFYSSPLKRTSLVGGYILSSYVIGVIMTVVSLILSEIYIMANGGRLMPVDILVKVLAVILLSVLSSSAMVFFVVSFFKSLNAFATASTVMGTLIGFLTGIYIPIGSLPTAVQYVIKIFPVSHAGVIFRQLMMEVPISESFAMANAEAIEAFSADLGVVFFFGGHRVTMLESMVILAVTTVVFYCLALINVSRKSK